MLVFFINLSLIKFQVRYLVLFLLFLVIDCFEWFWMVSLHMNDQVMLDSPKASFLVLHFFYYTLMTFLMILSGILLSMLMILLSILSVICGNNLNWLLNLNLIYETLWTGLGSGLLTSMLEKLNWFPLTGLITLALFAWKCMGLLTFSPKLYWVSYIISYSISVVTTASTKIGALIRSMKFLSPEVAMYLYNSTIHPCLEYCCHVWAGVCSCYIEPLGELPKQICRTVGLSLATSLGPLSHHWNVATLSLSCRYYFGRCLSELLQLALLTFSRGRSTHYSGIFHDFFVTIPRFCKDVSVSSSSDN